MRTTSEGERIVDILRRVRPFLSRRRKVQHLLLFLLMVVSAFADVVSLGAVLPFIGVMTSPERVMDYPMVSVVADWFGIADAEQLVLPATIGFVLAALVSGGLRMAILWATLAVSVGTDCEMSGEAYRRTLYQPYMLHLKRNSSDLLATVTAKTSAIAGEVLRPLVLFAGSTVIVVAVGVALLAIDAQIAGATAGIIGAAYLVTVTVNRRRLDRNGRIIASARPRSMKAIQEGLGGIRDVLLNGTQEIHAANYDDAFRAMRRARGRNSFINASPRLVLETVGVVALAGLTYGFSHRESGVADMLPVIAAVVFAAQRLIPTAHQLYSSWAALTGNRADILDALELLEQPIPPTAGREEPTPLALESEVRLDAVTFRYDPEGPAVLDGMGFVVQRGWRVGLVGATGSGKSTALDVLMGLLEPEDGQVVVDGRGVGSGERRAWQRSISHVPQFIYLADTSISENIALGIPEALVDEEALRSAADKAQILDFIEGLDEGFRTPIGERGVRLSGGQRQRIGLARAFYRRSDLLVLDEATSALDNETERAVVESLESEGDLTMVVVAHRLSTIRRCDRIYEIDGGRVIAAGTYDELLSQSPSFQAMAASPDRSEGGATQRSGEEAGP